MIRYVALFLLISLIPIDYSAFGDNSELIISETDKEEYVAGDILTLSGFVLEKKMPEIAISVYDPDGIILAALRADISDDGSFSRIISLDSPFYDKKGIYTIKMNYGKIISTIEFLIIDSKALPIITVPEQIEDVEFAPPKIVSLKTSKPEYNDGDIIIISGSVSAIDSMTNQGSVLVGIYDTFSNPAGFYFGEIEDDLEFNVSFPAKSGVNFKKDGTYSVNAHYGQDNLKIDFEFISKPSDTKPSDTKPSDTKPSDTKPSDTKPSDTKPSDTKPIAVSTNSNEDYDNLSVNDVELGIKLNHINLKCDSSKYLDNILYYDGMGPALLRLCKYKEAEQFLNSDITKNPLDIQSITNKGVVLSKMGYYEDAIRFYDSALSLNPKYIPALNNKANALAYLGKINEASILWQSASKIDPSYSISKINLEKSSLDKSTVNLLFDVTQHPLGSVQYVSEEHESDKIETSVNKERFVFENFGSILNAIGNLFGIIQ